MLHIEKIGGSYNGYFNYFCFYYCWRIYSKTFDAYLKMVNNPQNIINNLEEQKRSLIESNVPLRFYHPSNNRKIKKYFADNEVRFTCDEDAYMNFDDFIRFVEKLKKWNTYEKTNENISHLTHEKDVIDLTNGTYPYNAFYKSNSNFFSLEKKEAARDFSAYEIKPVNIKKKKKTLFSSSEDEKQLSQSTVTNKGSYKNMPKKSLPNRNLANTYNINKYEKKNSSTDNVINMKAMVSLKNDEEVILNSLLECRNVLAKSLHIQDPEQFISTKNLKLIIIHKPKTLDELRKLQLTGFSEEHMKNYGFEFLAITQSYNCD